MTAMQKYSDTQKISVEHFSDSVIDEFIQSRKASANTNRTYRNSLNQLVKFFTAKNIPAPTTADVDNFINELRAARKSAATLRLYCTVTKLFFAYLNRRGLYRDVAADSAPLKIRKSTTHKKSALKDEQAKKLLNAVKGDSLIERRDRAIIALALQTGVRTCEISRANCADLYQDDAGWFLDVQGKGRIEKDATVRVAPAVAELIQKYLDLRGVVEDDAPLFASASRNVRWQKNSYGNRLSEQSIGKMIKRMMKAVDIFDKKITAHSCRHYAATTAITSGVDIREISAMLRHSSLTVTAVYLHDLSVKTRRAELAVADKLFGDA